MGLITNLRVTLRLFADRVLRLLDLRDWFHYRRWLKSCRALTVKNVRDIYTTLGAERTVQSVEKMLQVNINFLKRFSWRAFPFSAQDKLEQLFILNREYGRELEKTRWTKPDPRSELFQRFWLENRR